LFGKILAIAQVEIFSQTQKGGIIMSKCPRITRTKKRQMREEKNLARELKKTINHFFPELLTKLRNVKDPRNQSYITYNISVILLIRILSAIFMLTSMRKMTEEFNRSAFIENVALFMGEDDLLELPHYDTINNCLERLEPAELQQIMHSLVRTLIRNKIFNDSKIRGKYWQIIIDGTQLYSFHNQRHCDHCLTRTHRDKDKNITSIDYYHYILEAKIVFNNNIVISIMSEFVENEENLDPEHQSSDTDIRKQDCGATEQCYVY
jgi:hypothetical protein